MSANVTTAYYDTKRVRVSDLSPSEKDQLLQEIVDHLGREIEVGWWSDATADRSVSMVMRR